MATTITITTNGASSEYTLSTGGRGPAGSDATVTNATVNTAIAGSPSDTRGALELGSAATADTGDFATAAHTHVSADITDATSNGNTNPEKLLKTDANGQVKVRNVIVEKTAGGVITAIATAYPLAGAALTASSGGAGELFIGANESSGSSVKADSLTDYRTHQLPDASGTIALTSDITGTNSGTNTGDQDLSGLATAASVTAEAAARIAADDLKVTMGFRSATTALTGGGASALDGIVTINQSTLGEISFRSATSLIVYHFVLSSGTDAESVPMVIRPDDYATTTNEKVWRLSGAWKNGKPLHWNSLDSAFHEATVGLSGTSLATALSAPIFVPEKPNLATALAAWKFNETDAAGTTNARDMLGTYHLTQTNTIPSTSGISGNARLFTAANTEYFNLLTGSHPFAFGDVSFTVTAWVKFTTVAATQGIAGVYNTTSNRCWGLSFDTTFSRIRLTVSNNGTATTAVDFGSSPVAGTWYFVSAYHDATNNQIAVSMTAQGAGSRAAHVTASHTTGCYAASNGDFSIGAIHGGSIPANAVIDEVSVHTGVLSTTILNSLFTTPGF